MEFKFKSTIVVIITSLAGIVFVFSGISKLWSFDAFELYIYSLNVLNLALTSLFSRILIAMEIFCGVLLFLPTYRKQAWYLSIFLLSLFSVYLIFILLIHNYSDCHCFGDLIRLGPGISLLKNGLLIVMLLLIRKWIPEKRKSYFLLSSILLIIIVLIFVLFPAHLIYRKRYQLSAQFNNAAYQEFYHDKYSETFGSQNKPLMLCFFSTGCKYCQLSAEKISLIASANSIPADCILYVFRRHTGNINEFLYDSHSLPFTTVEIESKYFFGITGGVTPLILLADGIDVYAVYRFRNINEKEITSFLKPVPPE